VSGGFGMVSARPLQLMLRVLETQNLYKPPCGLEPRQPPPCITSPQTHTPMMDPLVGSSSMKPRSYNAAVEG